MSLAHLLISTLHILLLFIKESLNRQQDWLVVLFDGVLTFSGHLMPN